MDYLATVYPQPFIVSSHPSDRHMEESPSTRHLDSNRVNLHRRLKAIGSIGCRSSCELTDSTCLSRLENHFGVAVLKAVEGQGGKMTPPTLVSMFWSLEVWMDSMVANPAHPPYSSRYFCACFSRIHLLKHLTKVCYSISSKHDGKKKVRSAMIATLPFLSKEF